MARLKPSVGMKVLVVRRVRNCRELSLHLLAGRRLDVDHRIRLGRRFLHSLSIL